MTFVNVTALRILGGAGPEIGRRFAARRRAANTAEGFEGFELLRPRPGEDRYFTITRWDTRECYDAWVAGRDVSARVDGERRGMLIELPGLEVVQHDEQNKWIATTTQMTAMAQVRMASLQVMLSSPQFLTVMVATPGGTPVRVSNAPAEA